MRTVTEIKAEIKKIEAEDMAYNRLVNEGRGGYERDSVPSSLRQELYAAIEAAFAAEWTPAVTEARKALWNASVKELSSKQGGKVTHGQMAILAKKLGYGVDEIVKAKAINGMA